MALNGLMKINQGLGFSGQITDPATSSDGSIWYRSDLKSFFLKNNSIARELGSYNSNKLIYSQKITNGFNIGNAGITKSINRASETSNKPLKVKLVIRGTGTVDSNPSNFMFERDFAMFDSTSISLISSTLTVQDVNSTIANVSVSVSATGSTYDVLFQTLTSSKVFAITTLNITAEEYIF